MKKAGSLGFFQSYLQLFWRPWEGLVAYASTHSIYDLHKSVQLAAFLATGWGITLAGRRLSLTRLQAGFAAALFVFSPAAVSALFQIDTVSQALATCAIVWLFLLLFRLRDDLAREPVGAWRPAFFAATAAACLACLATKETTLGAFAVLPLAAWIPGPESERSGKVLLRIYLPVLTGFLAYLLVRTVLVGIPLGAQGVGRYGVDAGPLNVLKNVAQLQFTAVFPGNTVRLMTGQSGWAEIAAFVVAATILLCGLQSARRSLQKPAFRALGLLVVASCFPHALGRASELYALQTLPFATLLVAYVLVPGPEDADRRAKASVRLLIGSGVVVLACTLGWISIGEKVEDARVTWQRSEHLKQDLLGHVNRESCRSFAAPESDGKRYYSVFVVRDVELYESLQRFYGLSDACSPIVERNTWSIRDRARTERAP